MRPQLNDPFPVTNKWLQVRRHDDGYLIAETLVESLKDLGKLRVDGKLISLNAPISSSDAAVLKSEFKLSEQRNPSRALLTFAKGATGEGTS